MKRQILHRRRHAARDPASRALEAEAFAERAGTNDAWLVAADAWMEAGDMNRARFAFVRQPRINPRVLTNEQAADFRRREKAWQKFVLDERRKRSNRKTAEGLAQLRESRPARQLELSKKIGPHLTTNEYHDLQLYEFLKVAPTQFSSYVDDSDDERVDRFAVGLKSLSKLSKKGPRGGLSYAIRGRNGYDYATSGCVPRRTWCLFRRRSSWWNRRS